jgi:hypothetical protein
VNPGDRSSRSRHQPAPSRDGRRHERSIFKGTVDEITPGSCTSAPRRIKWRASTDVVTGSPAAPRPSLTPRFDVETSSTPRGHTARRLLANANLIIREKDILTIPNIVIFEDGGKEDVGRGFGRREAGEASRRRST